MRITDIVAALVAFCKAAAATIVDESDCAPFVDFTSDGPDYANITGRLYGTFDLSMNPTAVYRANGAPVNGTAGCVFIQDNWVHISKSCDADPSNNDRYLNYMYEDSNNEYLTNPCFPYNYALTTPEILNLTDGEKHNVTFTTKQFCPACRDVRTGPMTGTYEFKSYEGEAVGCAASTDYCVYEKNGEDYCFQPNGLYETVEECPATTTVFSP